MTFTDELINKLLTCPKEVIQPPAKPKLERGHYRIGFELQSIDREFFFKAFGRYNEAFPENFSVGLVYNPKHEKGSYEILRCNGPHGEHEMFPHHVYFHIHKITTGPLAEGLKEDRFIEITDKYSNFDDALKFFVTSINLKAEHIQIFFPAKNLQAEFKFKV